MRMGRKEGIYKRKRWERDEEEVGEGREGRGGEGRGGRGSRTVQLKRFFQVVACSQATGNLLKSKPLLDLDPRV